MKLTREQQILVEENINLAGEFLEKYGLDYGEYIDVMYIALCEAALLSYDKESFKVNAVAVMKKAMKDVSELDNPLSLDYLVKCEDDFVPLVETLVSDSDTEKEAMK